MYSRPCSLDQWNAASQIFRYGHMFVAKRWNELVTNKSRHVVYSRPLRIHVWLFNRQEASRKYGCGHLVPTKWQSGTVRIARRHVLLSVMKASCCVPLFTQLWSYPGSKYVACYDLESIRVQQNVHPESCRAVSCCWNNEWIATNRINLGTRPTVWFVAIEKGRRLQ